MASLSNSKQYNSPNDFTDDEIIKLTGVLGVYGNLRDPRIKFSCNIRRYSESIVVKITTVDILELQITIEPQNRLIYNESLVKRKDSKKTGLAHSWVKSQVENAPACLINMLEGAAHKDDTDQDIIWIGYILWHKLGYLMAEKSMKEFDLTLEKHKLEKQDITKLLSTKEGIEFWQTEGFTWDCYFDLAPQSTSRLILENYKPSSKN